MERFLLLTHKVKVLVAEDHPVQRMLLTRNLEAAGYEVLQASNGEETLRIIETTFDLHLLITDMCMPIMDGQNLIKTVCDKGDSTEANREICDHLRVILTNFRPTVECRPERTSPS